MNPVDDFIDAINAANIYTLGGKVEASRKYRITVSMPCWGRPERTKRSIEAILAQDTQGWEAIVIGDKCPHFQALIDSGWIYDKQVEAMKNGNKLIAFNASEHSGGCGYKQTNFAIQNARGKYLVFYANDDVILPNHFSHYLEIEDTDFDYMYFNSYIAPLKQARDSALAPARIGHSEIIVTTELARRCRPHIDKYGHDWEFIYDVIHKGKGQKSKSKLTTYHVMHVPNHGTIDKID
jgi:glycosyltransferase involved in cell wall biosynthesis